MCFIVQYVFACGHAATSPFVWDFCEIRCCLDFNFLVRSELDTTYERLPTRHPEVDKLYLTTSCHRCHLARAWPPYNPYGDENEMIEVDNDWYLDEAPWYVPEVDSLDPGLHEIHWDEPATDIGTEEPVSPLTLGPGDQPLSSPSTPVSDIMSTATAYHQWIDTISNPGTSMSDNLVPGDDFSQWVDVISEPGTPVSDIVSTATTFNQWLDGAADLDLLMPEIERQEEQMRAIRAQPQPPMRELPDNFADYFPSPKDATWTGSQYVYRDPNLSDSSSSSSSSTDTTRIRSQGRLDSIDAETDLVPAPLSNRHSKDTADSSSTTTHIRGAGQLDGLEGETEFVPRPLQHRNAFHCWRSPNPSPPASPPNPPDSPSQVIDDMLDELTFQVPKPRSDSFSTQTTATDKSVTSGPRLLNMFSRISLGSGGVDRSNKPTRQPRSSRNPRRSQLNIKIPPQARYRESSDTIPSASPRAAPATERTHFFDTNTILSPIHQPYFEMPNAPPERVQHTHTPPPIPDPIPRPRFRELATITVLFGAYAIVASYVWYSL